VVVLKWDVFGGDSAVIVVWINVAEVEPDLETVVGIEVGATEVPLLECVGPVNIETGSVAIEMVSLGFVTVIVAAVVVASKMVEYHYIVERSMESLE